MIGRILFAAIFLVSGVLHFTLSRVYVRIMPPILPSPLALVYISGAAEIAGAIGLLIPSARHIAAWGLMALLIAVWPANIYTAAAHIPASGLLGQSWAQWLRVPLQVPLIYWAWLYTR